MRAPANTTHPLLVWAWSLVRLDFVGIAFSALFFCLSLTPSLLPRDWLFGGLIGGINAAIGYGIGVAVRKIFHHFVFRHRRWWPPPKSVLFRMKVSTVALFFTACLLMVIPAANWQRQVSALMGLEGPTTVGYVRTLVLAVVVCSACIAVAGLDQSGGRPLDRDDVQRRHRDGRGSILVSAELDLVPRRPRQVDRVRPPPDRPGPRPVVATAARASAQTGAVRRESWLDGRAGCLRLAARHRRDGLLRRSVGGPALREPAVERTGEAPRSRHARGRPRYDNGRTVRFTQANDDAAVDRVADTPWQGARVLFLQHSSDPIVWWSPVLLFSKPDWLDEPAGKDRTSAMRWYPIVTFWQVGADMTNAAEMPGGHGHNYGDAVVDGWAAVIPPDGWTPADTDRVREAVG